MVRVDFFEQNSITGLRAAGRQHILRKLSITEEIPSLSPGSLCRDVGVSREFTFRRDTFCRLRVGSFSASQYVILLGRIA